MLYSLNKEKGPYIIMEEDDIFRSYGVCDYIISKPSIDLNEISIRTSMTKKQKKYPKDMTVELFHDEDSMDIIAAAKFGSNGMVYFFVNKEGESVALKIPLHDVKADDEPVLLKKYNIGECDHYIIPIKTIYDQRKNPFIIMQEANGDISKLNMDLRLKIKLIIYIAEAMICLYKKKIIYYDLKADNVLYQCDGEKIIFYLGDIGGMAKENEMVYGGTYITPENLGLNKYKVKYGDLVYNFGCFCAELFDIADGLEQDGLTKNKLVKDKYPKFIDKLSSSNIPENIKSIIYMSTSLEVKERNMFDFNIVYELLHSS